MTHRLGRSRRAVTDSVLMHGMHQSPAVGSTTMCRVVNPTRIWAVKGSQVATGQQQTNIKKSEQATFITSVCVACSIVSAAEKRPYTQSPLSALLSLSLGTL